MPYKGRYIDRNSNLRAAGLPSCGPETHPLKDLLVSTNPLEIIHNQIEEKCRRSRPEPVGKRTPCLPSISVVDLMTTEETLTKKFETKLLGEKHSKSAKVGEIMPTNSKPSQVTNWSQTFGLLKTPSESLYSTIMPLKSDEQVNREYAEFHRDHIVSHNHYFPAEQINRGYTKPFERYKVFGLKQGADLNGTSMKKCMAQGDEHLTVVNKTWMDFMKRTKAPLGKKYEKYLDNVPDIFFGTCLREKCLKKIPLKKDDTLVKAISYLNELRHSLGKRNDFYMIDLITRLEKIDQEKTGHMPLSLILDTMHKLHIRLDASKIRTALSHFRLITDEGCSTERVNYHNFCRLLSVQENLPKVKHIRNEAENVDQCPRMETTYRLFTSDRLKKPVEGRVYTGPRQLPENVQLSDLISPSFFTQIGLGSRDFSSMRDKAQMERIFENIVSKEDFENIWQSVMEEQKEAKDHKDGMASVNQFRVKIVEETPPAS
ncbi:hypothetical protein KR032_003842 [Drosophila birchii]|nr:hypothetical protein KR032_003842 [Drosophila birchii]